MGGPGWLFGSCFVILLFMALCCGNSALATEKHVQLPSTTKLPLTFHIHTSKISGLLQAAASSGVGAKVWAVVARRLGVGSVHSLVAVIRAENYNPKAYLPAENLRSLAPLTSRQPFCLAD